MKSIQESFQKIKHSRQVLLLIITMSVICIIVGIASFLLGRASAQESRKGVYVEYPPLVPPYDTEIGGMEDNVAQQQYVASESGTKYYRLNCGGVSRIKEENKIYFESISAAEQAGYEPAARCF